MFYMVNLVEIEYAEIEPDKQMEKTIYQVLETCFAKENLTKEQLYVNIILTNSKVIQQYNKKFRQIDRATDVLSFPMFERGEWKQEVGQEQEVLGDLIISVEKVKEQAKEYGHSFERELAYMTVHGFYHLMGYDHMEEEDKKEMRQKEETILNSLHITRN